MARVAHSRLDDATARLLEQLRRRTGLSSSALIRRGLRALAESERLQKERRIVGLGRFASGETDLGSNKKHLAGFGRR